MNTNHFKKKGVIRKEPNELEFPKKKESLRGTAFCKIMSKTIAVNLVSSVTSVFLQKSLVIQD